jgi:uncharacterized protein Usg
MKTILSTKVLVTVGITYYRPDFRSILQEFVWQTPDVVPDLIRVHRFLRYWQENIEAIVERVDVTYAGAHEASWRGVDWVGTYFRGGHA